MAILKFEGKHSGYKKGVAVGGISAAVAYYAFTAYGTAQNPYFVMIGIGALVGALVNKHVLNS